MRRFNRPDRGLGVISEQNRHASPPMRTQLLAPATVATMLARPDLPEYEGKDVFYALGWQVAQGRVDMAHDGALSHGTFSRIARLPGGLTYAMLFNHHAMDLPAMQTDFDPFSTVAAVRTWPERDLYPSADP